MFVETSPTWVTYTKLQFYLAVHFDLSPRGQNSVLREPTPPEIATSKLEESDLKKSTII